MEFETAWAFVTLPGYLTLPGQTFLVGIALLLVGLVMALFISKRKGVVAGAAIFVFGFVTVVGSLIWTPYYSAEGCDVALAGVADGLRPTPSAEEISNIGNMCGKSQFLAAVLEHLAKTNAPADALAIVGGAES